MRIHMPRFEVFSSGVLIGHSELESGDPPMGIAEGRFLALPAYDALRISVLASQDGSQNDLSHAVRKSNAPDLEPEGPIQITDYCADLGPDGLEIAVCGIPYPLYEELFPELVASYRNQFGKSPSDAPRRP